MQQCHSRCALSLRSSGGTHLRAGQKGAGGSAFQPTAACHNKNFLRIHQPDFNVRFRCPTLPYLLRVCPPCFSLLFHCSTPQALPRICQPYIDLLFHCLTPQALQRKLQPQFNLFFHCPSPQAFSCSCTSSPPLLDLLYLPFPPVNRAY